MHYGRIEYSLVILVLYSYSYFYMVGKENIDESCLILDSLLLEMRMKRSVISGFF